MRISACVDFPAPSIPSKTIKMPLFIIKYCVPLIIKSLDSRYPACAGTGSAGMTVAMDSCYPYLLRSYSAK